MESGLDFSPKNGKPAWGSQVKGQPSGGSPSAAALGAVGQFKKTIKRMRLMPQLYRKPPFVSRALAEKNHQGG
jgi:hypothetical protein